MNSKRDEHDGHDGHDGHREVAVLSFRCRPSKFMNVAIKMRRAEDVKFVEGELRSLVFPWFGDGRMPLDARYLRYLRMIRTLKKPEKITADWRWSGSTACNHWL